MFGDQSFIHYFNKYVSFYQHFMGKTFLMVENGNFQSSAAYFFYSAQEIGQYRKSL